jgi:hypothetical protein
MTDALLLLLIAGLASVHVVLLVIRARHTAEMLRRASSVTPGTTDVQDATEATPTPGWDTTVRRPAHDCAPRLPQYECPRVPA